MKQREGFISNSSSSSFIIKKEGLTEEQREIMNIVYNLIAAIDPGPESGVSIV